MNPHIQLEEKYCAHNYLPLPVVLVRGQGVYVWDDQGQRYMDMMSAYSAVSHGHSHPRIVDAICQQAQQLAIVSRAFYTDKLGKFLEKLCQLSGYEAALPMNTGAEAVETALKAARKWAYKVKHVPENQAEIIACNGNFHGRTLAIVGLSSEQQYRDGFGPFPSGMTCIPYGDSQALEAAINDNTAAFLVEAIQGEGGIIVPPDGYLQRCAELCKKHNVLMIVDEVQTGMGRSGRFLAFEHENIKPDGVIMGKALGGGILPVSAFLANREVMDVFTPGDHGSTFGGNPLAATAGLEALNVLTEENLIARSAELGTWFQNQLKTIASPLIKDVRGKGLLIGIEIDPQKASAREVCERLMTKGLLSKETHETVVRLAPPLVITREELTWALDTLQDVLTNWSQTKESEMEDA